jgi:hypothetical protein
VAPDRDTPAPFSLAKQLSATIDWCEHLENETSLALMDFSSVELAEA